jgi:hypothetical protein
MITDLNSTNGIKVEGQTVKQQVLQDGMRVLIGSQLFRFDKGGSGSSPSHPNMGAGRQPTPMGGVDELSLDDAGQIEFASGIHDYNMEDSSLGDLDALDDDEISDAEFEAAFGDRRANGGVKLPGAPQ